MFVGIDGTGEYNEGEYWNTNHNSFVAQAVHESREKYKRYFRGPYTLGAGCERIAQDAVKFINAVHLGSKSPESIFLVGHSRGGAICVRVAEILTQIWDFPFPVRPLPIDAMFLFDAVNMSTTIDAACIPGNVKRAYHAIRDSKIGSRSTWGNCALQSKKPALLIKKVFPCTHAGCGGTPWTGDHPTREEYRGGGERAPTVSVPTITETEDKAVSKQVGVWMSSWMIWHGAL